jgi:glyoxalase family protein
MNDVPLRILGLHHVTATVDQAQPDLDFCLQTVGLRLVKKTVNFDNPHVYHFYYGDERGMPGTIWTTFPYAGHGVRQGARGAGQIPATAFSVPRGSLGSWRARLSDRDVTMRDVEPRFGDEVVECVDPSGLLFDLVEADDARPAWPGSPVPEKSRVRGLHSVTMHVRDAAPTVDFMRRALGYEIAGVEGTRTRMAVNGGGAGRSIDVVETPNAPAGVNGLGTVHHVAMAIETADEQVAMREELLRHGAHVTDVRDRCYFTSIYFREPGGVLFEIATMGPGFATDEPVDQLGRGLKLPPWEEPHRASIEPYLARVQYR